MKNDEQIKEENDIEENDNVDVTQDLDQKIEVVEDTVADSTKIINYIIEKIKQSLPHYDESMWKHEYEDVITTTFIDDTENTAKLYFWIEETMGLLLQTECPVIENTFIYFIKDSDIKVLTYDKRNDMI